MASSLGIPIMTAVSLDAQALAATTGHRHIYSIVDVRRGEFAVATYRPVPGGVVKSSEPELLSPDRMQQPFMSDPSDPLVVGDVAASPIGFSGANIG